MSSHEVEKITFSFILTWSTRLRISAEIEFVFSFICRGPWFVIRRESHEICVRCFFSQMTIDILTISSRPSRNEVRVDKYPVSKMMKANEWIVFINQLVYQLKLMPQTGRKFMDLLPVSRTSIASIIVVRCLYIVTLGYLYREYNRDQERFFGTS